MPSSSSVSFDRSRLRRLISETLNRDRSKRGIIHANRRFTPCMREPVQPRWSQIWTTFRRFTGGSAIGYHSAVSVDARFQIDRRIVAQLPPGPGDIERAALAVEIDAAAEERRIDPERHAHRFAQRARHPDRPHRPMHARRLDPKLGGDQLDEPGQRRVLGSGEDVGAPRGARRRAAQLEPAHEVADVGEVIEDLPRAEHRKAAARQAAKHLQEAKIARAVDADRPRHDDLEPAAAARTPTRAARLRAWCADRRRPERTARPRWRAGARCGRERRRCCNGRRGERRPDGRPRARCACPRH